MNAGGMLPDKSLGCLLLQQSGPLFLPTSLWILWGSKGLAAAGRQNQKSFQWFMVMMEGHAMVMMRKVVLAWLKQKCLKINQQWGGSFCKSTWDDRFWQRSLRTWPFRFDDSKGDTGIWRGASDASPGNEFLFHRVQGLRTWQLLAGDTVSKLSAHCCDKSVWNYFLVPSWGLWRPTGALWSLPFPHVGWVQELSVCCITKWIVARTSRSLTVFIG